MVILPLITIVVMIITTIVITVNLFVKKINDILEESGFFFAIKEPLLFLQKLLIPCPTGASAIYSGVSTNVKDCKCSIYHELTSSNTFIQCLTGINVSNNGGVSVVPDCKCASDYGWNNKHCVSCPVDTGTSNEGGSSNINGCKCITNNG